MDEYISREAVMSKCDDIWNNADETTQTGVDTINTIDEITDFIESLPTADVQPVKRGRWDFRGYQLFKCTNCKEIFTQNQLEAMQNHIDQEEFTFPNFCPNCGADMRGGEMADYNIQDKTEELNKRIDDAFTELDTQRNRMSGLTRENSELKQEIERLEGRINKTNNFIDFAILTYMCVAIAKIILIMSSI